MSFEPKYTITPAIVQALARIEVTRHQILERPITANLVASLRESARLAATHYSTAIEGNRLTMAEVADVVRGGGHFPKRERDETEVKNYYAALNFVERRAQDSSPLTEKDVQRVHGLAFFGKEKPTSYRDEQNVIRNGKLVVYIPPKAEDVPQLMQTLFRWIDQSLHQSDALVPVVAAIAHYQFATIHPYYDGNGRTARLLTTLILHQNGYDLKGIYSLEEYYTQNLEGYYRGLTVGEDEDYYDGDRADADITSFLDYFVIGMAEAFDKVATQAQKVPATAIDQSELLRGLLLEQRQALELFECSAEISAKEIAKLFDINDRQARFICKRWVDKGFIEISNPAPKTRRYKLAKPYSALF